MAMNKNVLLGPGGVPIQLPSNFKCPSCGHRPPVTPDPQYPPGTPMAMLTAIPGETVPQFNCLLCWNKFWAKFVRRHAPKLQMIVGGPQAGGDDLDEETLIDEEVE